MGTEAGRRYRENIREYSQYGIIYKAVLKKDGRSYIGQTTRSLKERISEHGHKNRFYFNNAIQKYGMESFLWEIIDYADSQEDLDRKERLWIEHYKSNIKGNGFNLTSGGEHAVYSEDSIKKMSEAMTGEKNHRYGVSATEDTRKKMSASRIGKHPNNNGVKIKCVETGKIYGSILEAERETGISANTLFRMIKSGKKSRKYGVTYVRVGGISSRT